MRRFRELLAFEVRLHLRRPIVWISFVLLLALSTLLVAVMGGDMGVNVNAPSAIILYTFILGLVGVLLTAALFADAGSRDAMTRMEPLLFTTPIRKREYLAGRYLGAWLVNAGVLVAVPVGLALSMLVPPQDAATVGPFVAGSYVRAYFYFLLPGLLINSAILFAIAALTRRSLPVYLGLIGLYLAYGGAVALTSEVMSRRTGAYADPTGIVTVLELMRDWSPAEKNTHAVTLEGTLLANRMLWTGVGFAILAFAWARFRFGHVEMGERRTRGAGSAAEPAGGAGGRGDVHVAPVRPLPAPRAYGLAAQARQAASVARRTFGEIVGSREFVVVAVILFAYAVFVGAGTTADRFGTPLWPVTGNVGHFLASRALGIPLSLLAIFYAGELVWRERDARLADIVDAAPLSDWAPLAGKSAALASALALLHLVLVLAGITAQAVQGWFRFEPGLYLRMLLGLGLVNVLIVAFAAMTIHVLVNQKYIGHLVAVLFFMGTIFAAYFGLRHNLLVYGGDPGWIWSDLSGFGPHLAPWLWMKAYWMGWALLLLVVATLFRVRGREAGARRRLRDARARAGRRVVLAAAPALLLVLATGGFVYYNTNVLNDYETPDITNAVRAEYERRYERFAARAQPKISHAQLHVEIHPGSRRAEATGHYRLVNRSGGAIDTIVVHQRAPLAPRTMRLDRPARLVVADTQHWTWVFALERPLPPGDSLQLHFDLAHQVRGFHNERQPTELLGNGTYLDREAFPMIGYQRSAELAGARERRDHGLPPRARRPLTPDSAALVHAGSSGDADRITFDAVVGTSGDQVATTAGVLVRSWTERGRRYAHHRSAFPTANTWAFLSARYAVRVKDADGVRLSVLHHPAHDHNVDRMLAAAERSLAIFTRAFGPNPFRETRFVEFPRYSMRASAYPNLVAISESFGFLSRIDGGGNLDTPLLVTAHELAHQWWGGQVMPANVAGRQVLTETLANYGATLVLNDAYGREAVERFLHIQLIEYLNRRGRGDQPLAETWDSENVHYRKGAVVMWTLRDYLGEERLHAALRAFVARYANAGPPYPTTRDLLRELRAVTPDSLGGLVTDLFETITIWDLRTNSAGAVPLGDGRWRVTFEVEAGRFRVDSAGGHTEVPMNDLVEVAVLDEAGLTRPLYLAKHRLTSGTRTLVIDVDGEPRRAGLDPRYLLIARRGDDLSDNLRDVLLEAPRER